MTGLGVPVAARMHAVDRELSFKDELLDVSSIILPEQWQKQLFFVILNWRGIFNMHNVHVGPLSLSPLTKKVWHLVR